MLKRSVGCWWRYLTMRLSAPKAGNLGVSSQLVGPSSSRGWYCLHILEERRREATEKLASALRKIPNARGSKP